MYESTGKNKLFYESELSDFLKNRGHQIESDISSQSDEYFCKIEIEEYLSCIEQQYSLQTPKISEDEIQVEEPRKRPVTIPSHYRTSRNRESSIDGVAIKVLIPVEGETDLFRYRPNQHFLNFIQANIRPNCIEIEYHIPIDESKTFKLQSSLGQELSQIKQWLDFMDKDIQTFNKNIRSHARPCIDRKIQNYKSINTLISNIPYPIKKREGLPETFVSPQVRRKPKVTRPTVDERKFKPEPTLENEEYNHILKICSDMALVMERSPSAFIRMGEEDLRTHFLVHLNGHYQGQATGETFNSIGKTDILIRDDNQNIFISECKYWHGEKGYIETIDQLLGYVTYRDTKTAIFVFVKNKDFSGVLSKIQKVTPTHDNFVSHVNSYKPHLEGTGFRYIFKNKNDTEKPFLLTVMAFHIPETPGSNLID